MSSRPPRLPRLLALGLGVLLLGAAGAQAKAGSSLAKPASTTEHCSSFGPSWAHTYDLKAARDGNPVRIISACCMPTAHFGVNSCFVTVTLAGTADRGCESVDISSAGAVVGAGKHEACTPDE